MSYQTQRERVKEIMESFVIPFVKKKAGVKYYSLIESLCLKTGVSKNMAMEVVDSYVSSGTLEEIRELVIPTGEVANHLMQEMEEHKKIENEIKGATENVTK